MRQACSDCELSGAVYDKHCIGCMTRLIIMQRSKDGKTSRRVQLASFAFMGDKMAAKVKDRIKSCQDNKKL